MSISGFGLTLAGTALGSITGIKAIRVGGVTLALDAVTTIESYVDGTATFTSGSDQVTGTDTAWEAGMAGRQIQLDADGTLCWIESVEDVDALTLTANYSDTGGTGAYTILPSRVAERLPLGVTESPLEIDLVYDKTLYDTLTDAALAQTEDTWTLTDVEGSTHVGLGRVSSCTDKTLGSDGHSQFTVTLTPSTSWEFTAAA